VDAPIGPADVSAIRSAALREQVRLLLLIFTVLLVVCPARAEFAGFEAGNGIAFTNGVVQVNFRADKAHNIIVPPGIRLGLMEVQLTYADGRIKRQTMMFAGKYCLRAPLPIEWVEIFGSLILLALLCGIMVVLNSGFRFRRADVPANGSGDLKTGEAPPLVS
jgi:hypothetical protein